MAKTKKIPKKSAAVPKSVGKVDKKAKKPTLKAAVKKLAKVVVKAAAGPLKANGKKVAKPAKALKKSAKIEKKPVKIEKKPVVKAAPKAPAKPVVAAKPAKPAPVAAKKVEKPAPATGMKVEKPTKAVKAKKPETAVVEPVVEVREDEEIVLTDAEGRRYCRVKDCDQISAVDGYCRYHYLLFWKRIQVRKKILSEGKLERYIEELTSRYPDKYLEMLRKDLRHEKDFTAAIQELEIDESSVDNEFEDEAQSYLDEVRGMGPESGASNDSDEF